MMMIIIIIIVIIVITKTKTTMMPDNHYIKEIQQTAILGTAHTLRNVIMYKYKKFTTLRVLYI